jgi:GntR family transcriptional regulator
MAILGHPPVSRVLKQAVVPASEQVAARLNLRPGGRVVEIERLRLVRGDPVVLTTTFLPHKLCPGLETVDLTRRSLYEYLESDCGLVLSWGRRTIEAVAADARQAKLLGIRKGDPLALIESVSYLEDGRPIEYHLAMHRGDRSRFEVELLRTREPGRAAPLPADHIRRLPPASGALRRGKRP